MNLPARVDLLLREVKDLPWQSPFFRLSVILALIIGVAAVLSTPHEPFLERSGADQLVEAESR